MWDQKTAYLITTATYALTSSYGTLEYAGVGYGQVIEEYPADHTIKFNPIFSFCESDCTGYYPVGPILVMPDGSLMGVTSAGATPYKQYCNHGCGILYQLVRESGQQAWRMKIYWHFCELFNCDDGGMPNGWIIRQGDSVILSTSVGGYKGHGTIDWFNIETGRLTIHTLKEGE